MKTRLIIITLFITLVLLISYVSTALALPPPLPSSFYGIIKVGGANAPDGTPVTAWINGVQYASTLTQTFEGDSVYSLDVPGDDPTTPVIEGGVTGDTVVFHIGDQTAAQTGSWATGTNVELTLTATLAEHDLTVAVIPTGGGTTNPAIGVHGCTAGTVVTVTATPNIGYAFANWSGACSGTGTCQVTMNSDQSVSANFAAKYPWKLNLPLVTSP